MMRTERKWRGALFLGILIAGFGLWQRFFSTVPASDSASGKKEVGLFINGLEYGEIATEASTVGEFLDEQGFSLAEQDKLFPDSEQRIRAGSRVYLSRSRKVVIIDGAIKKEGFTSGATVKEALDENAILLREDDLVSPEKDALAHEGETIRIIRVEIKEEKETRSIDFKKTVREDDELSWRTKKISQAGKLGKKELKYKAVYHDGKLISRKLLGEAVVEEPTEEISIQGTYVKLGKKHDGMASWYAFRGGMFAANPWLPMGSFVKVTNVDNGKSVIVKINDRGPFVPGRIIDLDKVAFQQIASLGAGVVHIKMEEILN